MTKQPASLRRGHARVTFRANLPLVRAELEQGWTAKAIFERHAAELGTMSYRQFVRYVAREIATREPAPVVVGTGAVSPPPIPPKPSPTASMTGVETDARHDPPPARPVARTFSYDGKPAKDDDSLIVGRRLDAED